MIEVTLGHNLVTCERPTFPALRPLVDLTADLVCARHVIVAADRFFLPHAKSVYSGFIRKQDELDGDPGPYFYIQLWHQGKVRRTAAFKDLGYTGVLHIELPPHRVFQESFDQDLIGDMCARQPEGTADRSIAYVSAGRLEIAFPYTSR